MKKTILSTIAIISIAGAVSAADISADSTKSALTEGKFTFDARVMYYDKDYDKASKTDITTLTAGGIMKYTTKEYMGLTGGVAYYGSARVGGIFSKTEGKKSSNLTSEGENLGLLGQAYLEYNRANTMLRVGRQQLDTPLMNDNDIRFLTTAYEAAVVRNTDIPNTLIEAGYVWSMSGTGSADNEFTDYNNDWGDEGLAYILLKNNSVKGLEVQAQYVGALSDTNSTNGKVSVSNYRYVDATYNIPFGQKTSVSAQYAGNSFNEKLSASGSNTDSTMLGLNIGTSVSIVDFALFANSISGNTVSFVQAGPMYTDFMIGYGAYDPSTAIGGSITVHPMKKLYIKGLITTVNADKDYRTDNSYANEYTEIHLDAKYKINGSSSIRVRYSAKDPESGSDDYELSYLKAYYSISI
jgi:hypothetical protein